MFRHTQHNDRHSFEVGFPEACSLHLGSTNTDSQNLCCREKQERKMCFSMKRLKFTSNKSLHTAASDRKIVSVWGSRRQKFIERWGGGSSTYKTGMKIKCNFSLSATFSVLISHMNTKRQWTRKEISEANLFAPFLLLKP